MAFPLPSPPLFFTRTTKPWLRPPCFRGGPRRTSSTAQSLPEVGGNPSRALASHLAISISPSAQRAVTNPAMNCANPSGTRKSEGNVGCRRRMLMPHRTKLAPINAQHSPNVRMYRANGACFPCAGRSLGGPVVSQRAPSKNDYGTTSAITLGASGQGKQPTLSLRCASVP
jgi:hypothetical protein